MISPVEIKTPVWLWGSPWWGLNVFDPRAPQHIPSPLDFWYAHVAGFDGLVANNPAAVVPGCLSTGNPDFPSLSTVEFL